MNIVALIIARISSVRLPRKNMLEVWGRPWIEWNIRQAVFSKQIDHTILISDSHEMAAIAKRYDVEVMYQPADYPGFGTVAGGGAAFNYAIEQIGNRIQDIDAFAVGMWSILRKPSDWDSTIDRWREMKAYNTCFMVRAVRNDLCVDVGDYRYLRGGYIKSERLLHRVAGAIQSSAPLPIWSEEGREKECSFYELEPWQEYGNVDYQHDFDLAEFLFYKHVLKDGECMTPYEDYFNDKGKVDVLQTRQEAYRDGGATVRGLQRSAPVRPGHEAGARLGDQEYQDAGGSRGKGA